MKVRDITPDVIDAMLSRLIHGDALHKPYSNSTVNQVTVILRSALQMAKGYKIIAFNPVDDIDRPRQPRRQRQAWTLDQVRIFYEATQDDDPLFPAYMLSHSWVYDEAKWWVYAGHLEEVADGTMILRVRQQVRQVDGKPQVAETKSAASRRDIIVPAAMVDILHKHHEYQAMQAEAFGWTPPPEGWPFLTNKGRRYRPDSVYHHYRKASGHAGLPPVALHSLRQVFAMRPAR